MIQGSKIQRFKRLKQAIRDVINGGDVDGTFFQILGFESRFLDSKFWLNLLPQPPESICCLPGCLIL
jgi:hypothetical protein